MTSVYILSENPKKKILKSRLNIPIKMSPEPCVAFSSKFFALKGEVRKRLENTIPKNKCASIMTSTTDLMDLLLLWISTICSQPINGLFVPQFMLFDAKMLNHFEYFIGERIIANVNSDLNRDYLIELNQLFPKPEQESSPDDHSTYPIRSPYVRFQKILHLNEEAIHTKLLQKVQESAYCQDLINHIQKITRQFIPTDDEIPDTNYESFYKAGYFKSYGGSEILKPTEIIENPSSFLNYHTHYSKRALNDLMENHKNLENMLFLVYCDSINRTVYFIPYFGPFKSYFTLCQKNAKTVVEKVSIIDLLLAENLPMPYLVPSPKKELTVDFDGDVNMVESVQFIQKEIGDMKITTPSSSPVRVDENILHFDPINKKRKEPEVDSEDSDDLNLIDQSSNFRRKRYKHQVKFIPESCDVNFF